MNELFVYILDTTLREGELSPGVNFSPQMLESVGLALAELGTPRVEFSVVYPQRGGRLQDLKSVMSAIHDSFEDVTTIVQCRAFKEDLDLAQAMDSKGCGAYIAISEEHRKHKLHGMKVDEVIERLVNSLDILKEYGFNYRRAVLEDASRFFSLYKGEEDTLENFERIVRSVDEAGATTISIPDTAGLLELSQAIEMFEFAGKITDKELAAHFHNDYGNALGNTLAVVSRGLAKEAHVSIYGLGSAVGIADHYEVSANLIDNLKIDTGENRNYLMKLYTTFQDVTKISIPWNHPLSDFARIQKAGTHQAQQLASPRGYVPPKKLEHDFDNKIFFQASHLMSTHLVSKLLEGYDLGEDAAREVTTVMAKRSALLHRKLSYKEIQSIVKGITGLELPHTKISQYINPQKAFYLLKVTPRVTTEITEKIEALSGVERALETFGVYDIIVEANANDDIRRRLEKLLGPDMIAISPLIVG